MVIFVSERGKMDMDGMLDKLCQIGSERHRPGGQGGCVWGVGIMRPKGILFFLGEKWVLGGVEKMVMLMWRTWREQCSPSSGT